ncbi:MAG: carboxypeptidase-like regulatory domain-containing protein [Bacteroidota bacterium]
MTKYLIRLLLLVCLQPAFSQTLKQTIKGRIIDEQSRTAVIGATVVVVGTDPTLGGITDVDGYFRIEAVPIGRQTLNVSSIGYEPAVLPEILVGSGKEVVLNIRLKEALIQMDEVVVSASTQEKGQPRNDLATISAVSLSVEQTSRFAATFDDPARAALTFAGVQTGGDDLLNEIVIRGNSPKGILWRLEGVEVPNPNHFGSIGSSAGGISMLSSNMLANSDFFTGAFPAQYGNATSGIFDLQLRQGNFDKNEFAFQAGLLGVAAAAEGPISKKSKASYLINYRYSTLGLLTNLGLDLLGEQEDVTFQDLSFKFHIPTKKLGSFSVWGLGGNNIYTFRPDISFGETEFEDDEQNMGVVGVTNVFYLSEDSFFETIVSASQSDIVFSYDSLRVLLLEKEDFRENQVRFSTFYNHKISASHDLRVGGIFSRLGYDLNNQFWNRADSSYIISLDEKDHAGFYQGFANWQFRTSERFTLNTGMHYSHFALNGRSYVEPRAGFRWNRGRHVISGGLGLHSRMETVALYTARQEQEDGSFVQPNKDLGFTRAFHAALGYEKMLTPTVRFKGEVYYQYLFDVPVWPNDTTQSDFARSFSTVNTFDGYTTDELANKGTGRNYGLELTLEKFLSNGFYFLTTTSLYKSLYSGADGVERSTQFDGGFIYNVLAGKEIQVGRNGNNTLGLNGKVIWAGGKREAPIDVSASRTEGFTIRNFNQNYETRLNNYFRVDIGISYRKNRVKTASVLALNVQNILQQENELARFYSTRTGEVSSETQLGFFPNLSYRIEF